jgi:hypothetical protein
MPSGDRVNRTHGSHQQWEAFSLQDALGLKQG